MPKKKESKKRYDLPVSIEALVLAGVQKIGDGATALEIFEQLRTVHHSLSFPSVYTALERMTWKGYVERQLGDAESRQGGRARKNYRITHAGQVVLKETNEIQERLQAMLATNPI